MEITRIEVLVGKYEDYCLLHTDVPGQWPTRRTNAEPFDTRKGNRLRLRFTTSGGKGVRYCKRHFPGVPIEIQREEPLPLDEFAAATDKALHDGLALTADQLEPK
jgi:hypothetical protein